MTIGLVPVLVHPRTELLREWLVTHDGRFVGTLRRRTLWSKGRDGAPQRNRCWDWHRPGGGAGPHNGAAAFLDAADALDDLLRHHKEHDVIPCPYAPACDYQATDDADLDEHLIHTPTEAPEHQRGGLPKRAPGRFIRQTPPS